MSVLHLPRPRNSRGLFVRVASSLALVPSRWSFCSCCFSGISTHRDCTWKITSTKLCKWFSFCTNNTQITIRPFSLKYSHGPPQGRPRVFQHPLVNLCRYCSGPIHTQQPLTFLIIQIPLLIRKTEPRGTSSLHYVIIHACAPVTL